MSAGLRPMDVAGRLDRLRGRLDEAGADVLVVTSMTNVRYLSGFTGSAAVLVVPAGAPATLLTDGRYATQAPAELAAAGAGAAVEVAPAVRQAEVLAGLVTAPTPGPRRVGLEAAHVPWARQLHFAASWPGEVGLVATVGVVEALRAVKDDGELDRMEAAAAAADAALAEVRPMLAERPRQRDVALALEDAMRRRGAAGPSFETIVASGPDGALPHHRAGGRVVEAGEAVVLDFGALVDGYCSDMTRTVWAGGLADATIRRAVAVVAEAQAAGVAAVREGVAARDVDAACREVIAAAGWADAFVHGTGHGVGLDIHEAPSVAATSTDMLAAGQVVTVEPGVYLPGLGGVRIEDTVVVTATGCRPLTTSPKDLP